MTGDRCSRRLFLTTAALPAAGCLHRSEADVSLETSKDVVSLPRDEFEVVATNHGDEVFHPNTGGPYFGKMVDDRYRHLRLLRS